jgi:tRNA dimethylallyltransferase
MSHWANHAKEAAILTVGDPASSDQAGSLVASRAKAVAIVGTNASGKSALGVAAALRFGGEIISADSRQVYRGLDIGTGKLTRDEMHGIRHHLIDVMDLGTRYSVADFQRSAYRLIDEITARGRLPIMVGGTGLYVRSVVDGYQLTRARPDLALRDRLEQLTNEELHHRLNELAPDAAETIDPRNRRRIIRAVEIREQGFPFKTSHVNAPQYEFCQLGLTWPRDVLRERIKARLRTRLDEGMIGEVRNLLDEGVSFERLEALGLEYRFVARFLRGEYASEEELFDELGRAIYRFAMRQLAWFRRDKSIIWLDHTADHQEQAFELIESFIKQP